MPAEAARVRLAAGPRLRRHGLRRLGTPGSGCVRSRVNWRLWLARVLRLAEPPPLVCAGRTDAGVHARGQVAHVDLDRRLLADPTAAARRLNRVLPDDLVVCAGHPGAGRASTPGSPRIWRRYVYRLGEPDAPVHPLYRQPGHRAAPRARPGPHQRGRRHLLGLRDFGAFCRRGTGHHHPDTAGRCAPNASPDGPLAGVVECTVRADAFCHSMVRSLVGALVEVGSGRRDAGLAGGR